MMKIMMYDNENDDDDYNDVKDNQNDDNDEDAHSSKVSFLALGGKLLLEAEACCFFACIR